MNMRNPELRRNLWLELSTHRLLAAPLVIALCAALIVATSVVDVMGNLATAASAGFVATVLIWGTQLAGGSVVDEARERTWDAQRMSAIGPWAMTWGKLLGAPAFAWYGGLILLLIFVATEQHLPVWRTAALLVCVAILLHAIALNASVMAARKGTHFRSSGILMILLLLFAVVFPGMGELRNMDTPVQWWGTTVPRVDFLLGTAAVFAAWALLGAYRCLCNALEIRTTPWALPALITFAAIYAAGFSIRGNAGDPASFFGIMACGVVVGGAFSYVLLLAEKSGAAAWQQLRARMQAGQWPRALQELPLWLVALATGLVFAIGATLASAGSAGSVGSHSLLHNVGLAPIAVMLFALRDAAIFQFFALARQPRRVAAATGFYLVLLYGIVPALLKAMGADFLANFVLPPLFKNPPLATAILLVQAGIAIALAYWRWRTTHAADSEMAK